MQVREGRADDRQGEGKVKKYRFKFIGSFEVDAMDGIEAMEIANKEAIEVYSKWGGIAIPDEIVVEGFAWVSEMKKRKEPDAE